MSASGSRMKRRPIYPRLLSVTFAGNYPVGTAIGSVSNLIYFLPDILKAIRDNVTLNVTGDFAGSTGTMVNNNEPNSYDPSIEELSFAGIQVNTPAHVEINFVKIGGKDQGFAQDFSQTGVLFAEILTFTLTTPKTKIAKIANSAQPDALILADDFAFQMQVIGAITVAADVPTLNTVFWVTPRKDLK